MMTFYLLTHILLTMSTGNEREGKNDILIEIFSHCGKMIFENILKIALESLKKWFEINTI